MGTPSAVAAAAIEPSRVVSIIGAGAMGAGIAQVAAAAGHPTRLFDAKDGVAEKAAADLARVFARLAERGKISAEQAQAAAARVTPVSAIADLREGALVIEAIVENLEVKRKVFAELEALVAADCILATNTSSISVTAIGAALATPQRLVGMHFFNPAPVMELVEVVSGLATDPAVAATVHATAVAWGKLAVHARSTPGFIVNRVARPYYGEGLRLLNEQAAQPATLDAVMREAGGFRMGPFELMDLIGHDVNFAVTHSVCAAYFNDTRFTPSLIQQELVNAGYLGRKSGRGFYDYAEGAAKALPQSEPVMPAPGGVRITGDSALAASLRQRLAGSAVEIGAGAVDPARAPIEAGGAQIHPTDGRTATQRAAETGVGDLVVVDLALDYATAKRIALAPAAQCSVDAWRAAVGLFQAAGFAVSRLADVPGLAVMRTVAMLANEASDAVNQGVCSAADVDLGMRKGVNYPRGPLAWADSIGIDTVRTVLANLAAHYGEDRYRVSPLLQRCAWSGRRFHD